ncbi:carcinoembryonic antigen-related cell adhesion molecule 5-like isoform X3 [Pygocentrus nattereri]|uniref:carcinoembryonic antigen-related cell adhesion molecule 5-like isoform X3 n=1 Tax=Pygocentrus nattereri TaxID=42514 RepID=UPI001891CF1A|nr:carcinoembryonic antigen-related cell adhesion molecule 5-like isoform X3 [Pygocentrus nattereri]XP_037399581.1 carcinoembryonic antigen-related cell adhesion molecule 5-like isoform X3 [Pygocentrus nattereri]
MMLLIMLFLCSEGASWIECTLWPPRSSPTGPTTSLWHRPCDSPSTRHWNHLMMMLFLFLYSCAGRKPLVKKLKDDTVSCSVPAQDKIYTIGCHFLLKSGMSCYIKYEDGTECKEPLGISWQEGALECEIENRLIPAILKVKRKSSTQDNKTSSSTKATPPRNAAKGTNVVASTSPGTPRTSDVCSTLTVSNDSLLVEYGEPVKVNCSIPSEPSSVYKLGWESQIYSDDTVNETSLVWTSPSLTKWEVNGREMFCYLSVPNTEQCKRKVHLTLYKHPDSVKISSESSVWSEGQMMKLKCEIENVGPLQNLTVQWTRVDQNNNMTEMPYGSFRASGEERKNGNVTSTLNVSASRDEDGVQYQCTALLKLEQLQQPQVGSSERLKLTVHYKPTITQLSNGTISLTQGDELVLNCSAHGNPSPQYSWSSPRNKNHTNSSIFINSVQSEDQGQYICTANNDEGSDSVTVVVNVVEDYMLIIIVCAVLCLVLLVIVVSFCYCKYYRHTHMGHYILKNLTSHRHNCNVAHNDTDQSQL